MVMIELLNRDPWRFAVGDVVYVAGHPQREATITGAFGVGRTAWPHYLVQDYNGSEWQVPQQCLSRSVIVP